MIRHYLGYTQSEMANKIGITRQAIAQIETGRMGVSDKTLAKLLRVYTPDDEFINYMESRKRIAEMMAE